MAMTSRQARFAAPFALGIAASLALAACSSTDVEDTPEGSDSPAEPAPSEPVSITFWSWLPDIQTTVDLFEEAHPDIDVTVENVGVGQDQYTKIQNAVDAGTGGPDVAQMTYDAIPNFVLTGALADLTQTGGGDIPEVFLDGVTQLVERDGSVYGVPQDFGPGVMYYRTDLFEDAGVAVPETWDEYADAAAALHAANPDTSITFIDPGLADAAYMGLWQNSSQPWVVDSATEISVDLGSAPATEWADYWTTLNQDGLLVESAMGSDEWFKQIADGQIATWIVGAWGLQALTGNVPDGEGLWRVAPQPTWEAGSAASSQFGGSATVVLEQSPVKEAATTFALWLNSDPVAVESLKNDQGLLPTTKAAWSDPTFLDEEIAYLGGQQARQVFAASAESTTAGWEWLPYQPYATSVYADTVGQAIANKTSIADGLAEWQSRIVEYGADQGFTVTE